VSSSYRTISGEASAELVVERSRFIGLLVRVEDETGARLVVEQQRRAHWGARHHCAAWVIGPESSIRRSHDDGEPSGSAGAPMLDVLAGAGLSDVVAVVSRHFGGVLLGTGGLARAYAAATRLALDEAVVVERVLQHVCAVTVDHTDAGRLQHELRSRGARVLGVDYEDQTRLRLAVAPVALEVTREIVAELTGGATQLEVIGEQWVDQRLG
jgi:uncharacterized YigZ family protein